MENITGILELFLLIITALGGFRQYILKPYFNARENERKWQEKLEKEKEERQTERDKRIEELEKIKEERMSEREKRVEEKYEQLSASIRELTECVKIMKSEHQKSMIDKALFDKRLGTAEDNIEKLWVCSHDLEDKIDVRG